MQLIRTFTAVAFLTLSLPMNGAVLGVLIGACCRDASCIQCTGVGGTSSGNNRVGSCAYYKTIVPARKACSDDNCQRCSTVVGGGCLALPSKVLRKVAVRVNAHCHRASSPRRLESNSMRRQLGTRGKCKGKGEIRASSTTARQQDRRMTVLSLLSKKFHRHDVTSLFLDRFSCPSAPLFPRLQTSGVF